MAQHINNISTRSPGTAAASGASTTWQSAEVRFPRIPSAGNLLKIAVPEPSTAAPPDHATLLTIDLREIWPDSAKVTTPGTSANLGHANDRPALATGCWRAWRSAVKAVISRIFPGLWDSHRRPWLTSARKENRLVGPGPWSKGAPRGRDLNAILMSTAPCRRNCEGPP
jgi:hypothetical protein